MFIMKLCESKLDGHPVNNIGHLCGKPHGYARHNDRCSSTAFRLCCHSHQKRESIVFLARFLHNIQRDSPTVVVEGKRLQFWDMDTMTVDRFEVLTPEQADKISIKNLLDRMSRHNGENGSKLMSLYKRVKGNYAINLFVLHFMI